MSGFGAVADGELVLRGGNAQRSDHHGGQGIGEFALEHRAFARHHAVMPGNFVRQKRRKNIRQMHLPRAFEIAVGELEVLRHHAEGGIFRAQNVTGLAQHFRHSHIRTHVAGAVVAGKQQLQLFAGLPGFAFAHHPAQLGGFDAAADPGFQHQIHHAADPPALVLGQSR